MHFQDLGHSFSPIPHSTFPTPHSPVSTPLPPLPVPRSPFPVPNSPFSVVVRLRKLKFIDVNVQRRLIFTAKRVIVLSQANVFFANIYIDLKGDWYVGSTNF